MERKKGIELYYMPASAQKKKNRIQFQLYYDTLQFNYLCFKSFFSMVFICFLCFGVLRDLIVLEMALVMAGEHLVSVVVDGLVSKLGSGLWSELGLVWNFKNDLDDMKKTLISIQAVLNDAEKQSIKNESVRLWLKRLKAAAYDIEDMLDQFQFQTQNQSKDTKVLKYFSCSKSFFSMSLPIMGHKLKSMKERLQRIAEERSNYSLKEESITNPQEVIEGRTTFSAVNKDEVLGRGEEATEIINRLLSPSDAVSIISIVGIGGLGKTTLAKLIFNDGRIKGVFKPKIWVHAMDLKLEKLVDNVLSSLGTENSNILRNLEAKIKRAKEILDGKRYLIVLDDWWNDDPQKWNDFKQVLQDGKGDSKIIVTTRNERVSSIMSDEAPHKLKFLSDDVCSKLFQQRAFGSDGARDQNLVSIGEKIVEKCQGVPLTANALGGMLRFKSGEDAWKEVLHSELWELKKEEGGRQSENEIISSLKLSYQYMPSPLKLCFVYCSLYPKAFELDKDMLIQQWIAQRFIQKEHVGDYYVNYLLAISFLEETKEETYKMHDLVYDLATSIAGDEVSVLEAGKSPKINPEECRYASMIEYHQPSELQRDLPRKVRALHFQECRNTAGTSFSSLKTLGLCDMAELEEWVTAAAAGDGERGTSLFPCLEKLKISGCPKLRVRPGIPPSVETLNLGRSMLPLLTGLHVCDEMSLKHLTIKRVEDTISLPESIRHLLTSLESLEIDRCKSLATLPEWLGELCSLRSLEIKGCRLIDHLPESIQRLTALETLHIRQCSESLEKCTEKETGEDWDKISHIPNIRISTSYPWEL
ncbi:putative disease resistance protein RGA4 isoform X3 [Typha angustifolia]|uniref:putative disease resistance protein RGA4 isoform X3 n=1 Tax=Typha angustifolia TaxID=59011 RepID=UPI003C2CD420